MAQNSHIEWTDATWNPIRGCSRVSEGCRNCYAEKVAYRFSGAGGPYEGLVRIGNDGKRRPEWNGQVRFAEGHLLDPLKWGSRKLYHPDFVRSPGSEPGMRIFVNSMSDLFHENVPDEWIDKIFAVMALCPQHTFQILTKRPERMMPYLQSRGKSASFWKDAIPQGWTLEDFHGNKMIPFPLPNVWVGVSVEDQAMADERIPLLLQTPAAVRFVSAEPLLGPIDLEGYIQPWNLLEWVIVGGESGRGARPMHPDWARSVRDQCVNAGVPFFFKQWGEWLIFDESQFNGIKRPREEKKVIHVGETKWMEKVGKRASGAILDGKEWREFPK